MKFERNIDPRTSMGVGQINNPLTICQAEYMVDYHGYKSTWTIINTHQLRTFLSFLNKQKGKISLTESGWRAGAFMRFLFIDEKEGKVFHEAPLSEIIGRCVRIEFEDIIYRIPSCIEI